ncbi:hypothetical protein CLOACE_00390 [Clostridium acetireducens DSM 10703]|jgi:uncharacterized protein|uniref:Large ribosomal RNA subunit accumulation protein YceD n=1 Tax=Clostridium acetireducens DSM 10703 TaxID=1121290 RepID=A0A1E8F2C1_9CLOT|nr:DUF177 domain-containing protein [Clostridium acetireducens]OFI07691.1 hypothetical protein CLOACE_00390 [Clostridium acetireducens DSM 10703]
MKIDVQDLVQEKVLKKDIDLELKKDILFDGSENIKFLDTIKLKGSVSKMGNLLHLEAKINTNVELSCSRCLSKFPYKIDLNIVEEFSNCKKCEDEDVISIECDEIDIAEVIMNNIIMALPIKRLCKENCKGLCQQCGTNLNYSKCNCKDDDVDPRLAQLKDFF